ncbi:OmpP1/FadL family transporter [Ferrimonas pelagia]|uniref:Outer membrane protein transport protein n=1 Tax=Ferrimonas pelagia TaxID=1177826 RepID=A0ABP9F3Y5_9GAMM
MKIKSPLLVISLLAATQVHAGGIRLHELASFDSLSSAGAANATQRRDASAVISNPAGLTHIEDSSLHLGLMSINGSNEFFGTLDGILGSETEMHRKASSSSLAPNIAYAKRVSDNWVLAGSLHAVGGLGEEYANGLAGQGFVDDLAQEAVNLQLGVAYSVNERLSLGAAAIVQYMRLEGSLLDNKTDGVMAIDVEGDDINLGAMLSANYLLGDRTLLAANYQSQIKHDLDVQMSVANQSMDLRMPASWPAMVDLGLDHQLNEQISLKTTLSYEMWSQWDDTYNDSVGIAVAGDYQVGQYRFQAGFRYDSAMMDVAAMTPALTVGTQWTIGSGVEYTRGNGHRVGLSYEYREINSEDVEYAAIGGTIRGAFDYSHLHLVALSYAF